jgi:hypothetical protein
MTAHLPQFSRSNSSASPSCGKAVAAPAIKGSHNDITLRDATLCTPVTSHIRYQKMLVLFVHRSHHLNRRASASFNAHMPAKFQAPGGG